MFIPRLLVPGKEHAESTAYKAGWTLQLVWIREKSENSLLPVGKSKHVQSVAQSLYRLSYRTPLLPHSRYSLRCCSISNITLRNKSEISKACRLVDRKISIRVSGVFFSSPAYSDPPEGTRNILSN